MTLETVDGDFGAVDEYDDFGVGYGEDVVGSVFPQLSMALVVAGHQAAYDLRDHQYEIVGSTSGTATTDLTAAERKAGEAEGDEDIFDVLDNWYAAAMNDLEVN